MDVSTSLCVRRTPSQGRSARIQRPDHEKGMPVVTGHPEVSGGISSSHHNGGPGRAGYDNVALCGSVWSRPVAAPHRNPPALKLAVMGGWEGVWGVGWGGGGTWRKKLKIMQWNDSVTWRQHLRGDGSVCVSVEGRKPAGLWSAAMAVEIDLDQWDFSFRTLNLLIPGCSALLTMTPLTVSMSWGTVLIPFLCGTTLEHPWGRKGSRWGSDSRDGTF